MWTSACAPYCRWLGWKEPDPKNVHYPVILESIAELQMRLSSSAAESIYLWVDYFSIPQLTAATQRQAISSISTYAAVARYFIVVAPETQHADSEASIGQDSYLSRGWCRLEQWAAMAASGAGMAHILLYNSDNRSLTSISSRPEWVTKSIQVFQGVFTRPSDRADLVDIVLGVYAFSIAAGRTHADLSFVSRRTREEASSSSRTNDLSVNKFEVSTDSLWLAKLIATNKRKIFPVEWFGDMVELLEHELQVAIEERESKLFSKEDFISLLASRQCLCQLHGAELPEKVMRKFEETIIQARSTHRKASAIRVKCARLSQCQQQVLSNPLGALVNLNTSMRDG